MNNDKSRKKLLVTGGTVFVSRFVAEYFVKKDYEVYVLNRNTRPQSAGITLIEADRKNLGDALRHYHFDVIIDVNAYTEDDINMLLDAVGGFGEYVFISSSAVYPEYCIQPFTEDTKMGENKFWGKYGTEKIAAEKALQKRVPDAYILRPPYLYGPLNNVYREAFVFDCAMQGRKFYLPKDGQMKLQFFHVKDLCRFMEVILEKKPERHIFNVGNKETITIRDWVKLCYQVAGKEAAFKNVYNEVEQRNYFSFYNYEYYLDVQEQYKLMPKTEYMETGLKETFTWYQANQDKVMKKPYMEFIDQYLG